MKTIMLEKYKFAIQQMISEEYLNAEVDIIKDSFYNNFVIRLRGYVWAEKIEEAHETIEYPATWWDMFKQDHFPEWAIERWPIKFSTRTIVVKISYKAYPNFNDATRNNKVKISMANDIDWNYKNENNP